MYYFEALKTFKENIEKNQTLVVDLNDGVLWTQHSGRRLEAEGLCCIIIQWGAEYLCKLFLSARSSY